MIRTAKWFTRLRRESRPRELGIMDRHPRTPAELEQAFREGFHPRCGPSVGVEEELILVDPVSLMPEEAIDWALGRLGADSFAPELRAAQVELVTAPASSVGPVLSELRTSRARLLDALGGRLRLIAAGGHPALAHPVAVTNRPRYLGIGSECSWAMRRGLTCAVHVHVGLDDPDEALGVYNAARSYLPELAALAANSPFFEGADSGLASSRLKLTEDLPRSGIPPAFGSWREYAEFVAWGTRAGLFPDPTYLWWDLRLRPELGTLEFRIADVQTSLDCAGAIAAICQALVAALEERLREGELLPVQPAHVLAENRWRALRDGLSAELADLETGLPETARYRLGRLLGELESHAQRLGSERELAHAWRLLARNGADRQREVAADGGVLGLLEWLADCTEAPAGSAEPIPPSAGEPLEGAVLPL